MKKGMLLALVLVFSASIAFAGPGSIGIFADNAGTNCNLPDAAGFGMYYIVHVNTTGSTACMYMALKPACFTGNFFADQNVFGVVVGNSQTGVSVGYGSCLTGNILVQTMVFMTSGTTPNCCYWTVVPHPFASSGKIEAVDCFDQKWYPTGGQGIVKSLPSCNCNVPAEETTWGKVKAIFAE